MEGTMTSCTKPSIKDSEGPMARFHLIVDLKLTLGKLERFFTKPKEQANFFKDSS
jgi:hypothetical protein